MLLLSLYVSPLTTLALRREDVRELNSAGDNVKESRATGKREYANSVCVCVRHPDQTDGGCSLTLVLEFSVRMYIKQVNMVGGSAELTLTQLQLKREKRETSYKSTQSPKK